MLRNRSGSAIIIVLIIAMISISLTIFTIDVSKKIINSSNMLMDKLHAKFGALSEMEKLKFYISTGRMYPMYVSNKISSLPDRIYVDGRKLKIDNCTVTVQDSGGLINVFLFDKKLLNTLFRTDNLSYSQISVIDDSILDWYDKDSLKRTNGAEDEYYKSSGFNYTPRNFGLVQSIYEWHNIRGLVDNRTFNFVKHYLTCAPKWHKNINTMSNKMLSFTFNIPLSTADAIVGFRNKKNGLTLSDIKRLLGINIDAEEYGTFPTFVLDINVQFRFNDAMENVSSQIQFIQNEKSPYRILKWQN